MADQTQFDLNKEIALWRENLWLSGNFSSDELEELESHLYEELGCASFAPLHDEEKFLLARHKIGSDKTLIKAYSNKRLISFTKISWIAQAAMCVLIFLIFSRAALFALRDLDVAFLIENLYLELALYWSMQFLGGVVAFLIFRKAAKISRDSTMLHRANGMVILSTLIIITLFLIYARITDIGFVLKGPLMLSILPIAVFVLLFLGFTIANFRYWRKAKLA